MKSENEVDIRLRGSPDDNGDIRLEDFTGFCARLTSCLKRSEQIVSQRMKAQLRYRITNLKNESVGLSVEPIRPRQGIDLRSQVVHFFRDTIAALQRGSEIDQRIGYDDLQAFRELASPLARNMRVDLAGTEITTQYIANIDKLLAGAVQSLGSVSGKLERINVHDKNEFALYPPTGDCTVVCTFADSLWPAVEHALKKHVTVTGLLTFDRDKPFPTKVTVESVEINPDNDELPTLHDVRALGKWDTQGLSAVEYLRIMRNEQDATV